MRYRWLPCPKCKKIELPIKCEDDGSGISFSQYCLNCKEETTEEIAKAYIELIGLGEAGLFQRRHVGCLEYYMCKYSNNPQFGYDQLHKEVDEILGRLKEVISGYSKI